MHPTGTPPQPFDATPENRPQTTPPRLRSTHDDAPAPAESVRVTDRPATPGGRCYLVERGLQTKGELDALIADYLAEAQRTGAPPLAHCPVDRYLDAVA